MDFYGVKVLYGTTGSYFPLVGDVDMAVQDQSLDKMIDIDEVRNGNGEFSQATFYNPTKEATMTYIRYDDSASGGSLVVNDLVRPGSTVLVTDPRFLEITGSWKVIGSSAQRSNTGAMREVARLKQYNLF